MDGKAKNKQVLQKKFGLAEKPDVALFGFVGRFADQKGIYLLQSAMERAMNEMVCQFVVIGSGGSRSMRTFLPISLRGFRVSVPAI